jgi:N-acyl-D-aspartate/D-glutamate deacylase
VFGIGRVLGELGTGVFELAVSGSAGEDLLAPDIEMAWMRRLSAEIRRPITFGSAQNHIEPDAWRHMYEACLTARAEGADLHPQTLGRAQCVLLGHQTLHPFLYKPSYQALIELPLADRVARLRDPETKRRILAEDPMPPPDGDGMAILFDYPLERIYAMGEPPDYEPTPETSVAELARRQGRDPLDVLYDMLLRHDGRELLMYVLMNYGEGDLSACREMLLNPQSVLGLSDGGAHYAHICDASASTFLLTHWARDRARGERLPLELVVQKQTSATADLFGLHDRGRLVVGAKADVNVIDFDNLSLRLPEMVHDLPTGAGRLMQEADGYLATVLSGQVIREGTADTGLRPGRVIRGEQHARTAR